MEWLTLVVTAQVRIQAKIYLLKSRQQTQEYFLKVYFVAIILLLIKLCLKIFEARAVAVTFKSLRVLGFRLFRHSLKMSPFSRSIAYFT